VRATYEVAQERKTGFVDAATAFHKAGSVKKLFASILGVGQRAPGLGTHLDRRYSFAAIGSGGRATSRPQRSSWMKARSPCTRLPPARTLLSSFEPAGNMVDHGPASGQERPARRICFAPDEQGKEYPGFGASWRPLGLIRENSRVLIDVFNPTITMSMFNCCP